MMIIHIHHLRLFFNQFDNPRAFVLKTPRNRRKIFPYLPYHLNLEKENSDPDLNHALDEFYEYQANRDWVRQKSGKVERVVKNEQKKAFKEDC